MKFSFLLHHLFDINILFVLILIKYSAEQDSPDWAKVNDVVYKGPKYVDEGQTFEIMCRMSKFNAPKWTKNDIGIDENNRFSFENQVGIDMTRIEILTVTNASAIDSGVYRCNSFSRAYHRIDVITSKPITSIPESSLHSDTAFEEIKEEFSTVVLNCYEISNSDDLEIRWFKNSVKIPIDGRREVEDTTLIIRNATSAVDAGDYSCLINSMSVMGGSVFGQLIQLRAPIRIIPFNSPQSVIIGRNHSLRCDYTGYPVGKIKWIIGNKVFDKSDNELNIKTIPNENSHPDSILIIENITESHKNSYTCIVDNGYTKDEASVLIKVRESVISTNSPIILLENKALNIICNNTDNNRPTEWIWKKDGIVYDDFPPESKERIKIDAKDNSIFINKASKEDIGVWVCEQKGSGSIGSTGPISAEIKVVSKPWLMPFEEFQKTNYKSANIVEGQRFHLNCKVIEGYDRDATIKWYRFNESDANNENRVLTDLTEQPNSRIRIERLNDTEQTLTIEKVAPNDRFFYVCSATNGFLTFNNTILLRVKDKLGALWPFLAIVAEVVILCTIIFIYEKRRIKPDFDDTENDNNTEPKAAQDSTAKTQDVRQRK